MCGSAQVSRVIPTAAQRSLAPRRKLRAQDQRTQLVAVELNLGPGQSGCRVPTTGQPGAEGRASLLSPALSCPLRLRVTSKALPTFPPQKNKQKKKLGKPPNVRAEKTVLQRSRPWVSNSFNKKDSPTHFIDEKAGPEGSGDLAKSPSRPEPSLLDSDTAALLAKYQIRIGGHPPMGGVGWVGGQGTCPGVTTLSVPGTLTF